MVFLDIGRHALAGQDENSVDPGVDAAGDVGVDAVADEAGASRTISGCGLPMTRGRRLVAVKSISITLPQSGAEPYQVGQTMSGCVAM